MQAGSRGSNRPDSGRRPQYHSASGRTGSTLSCFHGCLFKSLQTRLLIISDQKATGGCTFQLFLSESAFDQKRPTCDCNKCELTAHAPAWRSDESNETFEDSFGDLDCVWRFASHLAPVPGWRRKDGLLKVILRKSRSWLANPISSAIPQLPRSCLKLLSVACSKMPKTCPGKMPLPYPADQIASTTRS